MLRVIIIMEKTIKLNTEEDKFWVTAFQYYCDLGYNDLEADAKAFKELIEKFPRLKGCKKIK